MPPFAVHFVVGEEDGGLGAYATLARGHTGDACVIPEPTDLRLVTANAGSLTFRIEVPGQATHGSTRYEGHSAIDAYLPIHAALAELERRRNADPEPLAAGLPDPVSAVGGQGPGRGLGQQRAGPAGGRGPLRPAGDRGPGDGPGRAGGRGGRGRGARPLPPRPSAAGDLAGRGRSAAGSCRPGHPLGPRVAEAHRQVTGRDIGPARGGPYGSDLRLYAGAGIPTLHYGPGSPREAHGPDESVPIEELVVCAGVLERLLVRTD